MLCFKPLYKKLLEKRFLLKSLIKSVGMVLCLMTFTSVNGMLVNIASAISQGLEEPAHPRTIAKS